MYLFKEKIVELVFNVLAWSIIAFVFLLVGGGFVLFIFHFPYIVTGFILLIIAIFVGIHICVFTNRLLTSSRKTHKKTKNEHDTKFKTH